MTERTCERTEHGRRNLPLRRLEHLGKNRVRNDADFDRMFLKKAFENSVEMVGYISANLQAKNEKRNEEKGLDWRHRNSQIMLWSASKLSIHFIYSALYFHSLFFHLPPECRQNCIPWNSQRLFQNHSVKLFIILRALYKHQMLQSLWGQVPTILFHPYANIHLKYCLKGILMMNLSEY